jgi:beta-xylosidase
MPQIKDIQIRDPFILCEDNRYYLFGSTDKDIWRAPGVGFDMYTSTGSLTEFEGPIPCFRPQKDFWSEINFWAPEVYKYSSGYYMFATFKPKQGRRGTAVLKTKSLAELFMPWSDGPVTPAEWECLDGTLYVDPQGKPWMIFCHEWQQAIDGEICLMPLSDDLKTAAGEPELLFRASEAAWASPIQGRTVTGYVTDGPNIYTAKNGTLLMLWSSFGPDRKYRIGVAVSESGIHGPWKQLPEPLYAADGGHGMIFCSMEGKLYLTVHTPNNSPNERPIFIEIIEENSMVKVGTSGSHRTNIIS